MREFFANGSLSSSCIDLTDWFDDLVSLSCRKDVGIEGSSLDICVDCVKENGEVVICLSGV